MIDCALAHKLMNGYIDGILKDTESLQFEEHISCCEKCREEYDMMNKISYDLAKMNAPIPEDFGRKVHVALVNEQFKIHDKKEKKIPFAAYSRFATVTAAALVIAVVGRFGVYDTYKKVMNDSAAVLTETTGVQTAVETDAVDSAVYTASEKVPEVAEIRRAEPVKKAPAPKKIEETPAIAEVKVATEDIAPEIEEANQPLALARTVNDAVAASGGAEPETEQTAVFDGLIDTATEPETIQEDTEKTAETKEKGVEPDTIPEAESQPSSKEPAPAVVTVQKHGEASMAMFKKYLYTFLNGDEISENGEEITVTVSAEDYHGVIEKISRNEYVKSVVTGVAGEEVGEIIIKLSE